MTKSKITKNDSIRTHQATTFPFISFKSSSLTLLVHSAEIRRPTYTSPSNHYGHDPTRKPITTHQWRLQIGSSRPGVSGEKFNQLVWNLDRYPLWKENMNGTFQSIRTPNSGGPSHLGLPTHVIPVARRHRCIAWVTSVRETGWCYALSPISWFPVSRVIHL